MRKLWLLIISVYQIPKQVFSPTFCLTVQNTSSLHEISLYFISTVFNHKNSRFSGISRLRPLQLIHLKVLKTFLIEHNLLLKSGGKKLQMLRLNNHSMCNQPLYITEIHRHDLINNNSIRNLLGNLNIQKLKNF